jgi:predicted nucleic acid-binding protein
VSEAREVLINYLEWDVVDNDRPLLLEGIRLQDKCSLSFWDALIIAAAKRAKARELWSEDLNNGQHYEGILVINPLTK